MGFHFDYRSPYSYLALTQLGDLALTLHPFDVLDVMKRVGNSPTTIICKAKGDYAGKDLARWTQLHGVPFSRTPHMREIDGRRLVRATLAIPDGAERRKAVVAGRQDKGRQTADVQSLPVAGCGIETVQFATLDINEPQTPFIGELGWPFAQQRPDILGKANFRVHSAAFGLHPQRA